MSINSPASICRRIISRSNKQFRSASKYQRSWFSLLRCTLTFSVLLLGIWHTQRRREFPQRHLVEELQSKLGAREVELTQFHKPLNANFINDSDELEHIKPKACKAIGLRIEIGRFKTLHRHAIGGESAETLRGESERCKRNDEAAMTAQSSHKLFIQFETLAPSNLRP